VRFPPELVAPATLLWVGGVAAVVAILRRPDENPEYAEVVDEGARPPGEETVEETAESVADHAEDEVEVEEEADESVEPVDDDEVDTPPAVDLDDEDDDTDDTDDTERLTPERDAPPVEAVDVDPPPAAAVAPRRRKVFRRRAAEPPAPKRPRTVADLVAERAAAERAAREDDAR
jgi:hypothetical protein